MLELKTQKDKVLDFFNTGLWKRRLGALSTASATTVVRYLQDKVGISPLNLSAAGFAENKPVASNETQDGKAQNRRIEIVLLPLDVDRELEDLKK